VLEDELKVDPQIAEVLEQIGHWIEHTIKKIIQKIAKIVQCKCCSIVKKLYIVHWQQTIFLF